MRKLTCNISVTESSGCITQVSPEVLDVPADIERKLSTTLFENPTWNIDVDKQHASAISCNISQTQYLSHKLQFSHTTIYEYI